MDRVGRPLAGGPHRGHHLAEQALGDQLVVRLGPVVAGERLVGDLGWPAAAERVVDVVPGRAPLEEAGAGSRGGVAKDRAQVAIALRVEDDRRQPREDVGLTRSLPG